MKKLFPPLLLLVIIQIITCGWVSALSNPTHFVDTQWHLNASNEYDSIEVDITPTVEEGTATDGYYFANTVYFRNYQGSNFGGAYAGLQTNGYDGSQWVGKMALFSVWDVSTGVPETYGKGTTFGGEGTGFSVRIPYDWQINTSYRLKIYIDQDASSGDRLWGASLTNLTNGVVTRIGRIYVPASRGKIYGPVTFHERYMGPVDDCSAVKKSQVSFTNMTANGGSVKASSWNHYYIAPTPECPGLTWLKESSNGYQSGIATPRPSDTPTTPAVSTPTTPSRAAVPEPAPTPTEPSTEPNIPIDQPATTPSAAPQKKSNYWKLTWILLLILAVGGFIIVLVKKRYLRLKFLKQHFPHDYDFHGHKPKH
jgi:hypothetical protein